MQALVAALIAGIPTERSERSDEQQALWLLAHLLDFHRREAKAPWWEFFRLRDLTEEDLLDEKAAVGGLRFVTRIGITKRGIPTDRYSYPPQETDIRSGDELHLPDGTDFGTVESHRSSSAHRWTSRNEEPKLMSILRLCSHTPL